MYVCTLNHFDKFYFRNYIASWMIAGLLEENARGFAYYFILTTRKIHNRYLLMAAKKIIFKTYCRYIINIEIMNRKIDHVLT
jgi:hypothetical protein